jgi:cell division protein FtsB
MKKEIADKAKKRRLAREKSERANRRLWSMVCAVLISYITVYFGAYHYKNYVVMNRKLREIKTEHTMKTARIKELREEALRLQDPEYLKAIARRELYLMDTKEVPIRITPDVTKEPSAPMESEEPAKQNRQH